MTSSGSAQPDEGMSLVTASTAADPSPTSVGERFPAVANSVSAARRLVTGWLRASSADALMVEDIGLAVSEACTNVVMHGYLDGSNGSFSVSAESAGASVRVTVSDEGGGMAPRPDSPGLGLGLPLMAALTDSLEVRPAPDGTGTIVSMLFTVAGARERISPSR